MTRKGAEIAAAAEGLIGAPFRLGGRDRLTGLDCLGLAGAALGLNVMPTRALRRMTIGGLTPMAEVAGLRAARGDGAPGDLVLVQPGPAQFHLLIETEHGFVHAHAGLRRVVLTPRLPPWPVLCRWRATGEG